MSVTGWAQSAAFVLTPMRASVHHAAVAGLRAKLAVILRMSVAAGSSVQVVSHGVRIECATEGSLFPISLPAVPVCTEVRGGDSPSITLDLPNTTFTIGDYAFAVALELPMAAPGLAFDVLVRGSPPPSSPAQFELQWTGKQSSVVDAIFGLPGLPLHDLPVLSPEVAWSTAEADRPTDITMGLTLIGRFVVSRLAVTLPPYFFHELASGDEIELLNALPVVSREISDPRRVVLELDPARPLNPDTYKWQFPVLVPFSVPAENLWFLELCGEDPGGETACVDFPIPGFDLGERSPRAAVLMARAALVGLLLLALG